MICLCTGKWTIANVNAGSVEPLSRSCAAHASTLSQITLVFGGWDGRQCLANVQRITTDDEDNITVDNMPDLSLPLKNATAVALSDHRFLLFGGYDERTTLDTVFEYNSQVRTRIL
jgi:hypothetical protein